MSNGKDDDDSTKIAKVRELRPSGSAAAPPPPPPPPAGAETKIIKGSTTASPPSPPPPPPPPPSGRGGGERGGGIPPDPGRTIIRPAGRPPAPAAAPPPETPAASNPAPTQPQPHPPAAMSQEFDPVVGWLIVVEGPGRGISLPIYEGMNSVGRDVGQRIIINFGDGQISREGHFFVTYEPKKRNFYINHGAKSNLLYRNDEVVLGPELLNKGDTVKVGSTKLMFVPLCGADFNWDSMA